MTVADVAPLLRARTIAAIGASSTRDKLSGRLIENLLTWGYPGSIVPVNPHRAEVSGLPTVASIGAVEEPVDVAFVSVPPDAVCDTLYEVAAAGVPFAIVLTSGFESPADTPRRAELLDCLKRVRVNGLRVCGPNCIGIVNVADCMVLRPAMFIRALPAVGPITVISQSGGLSWAVLNEAAAWGIGLREVIHTGNEFDLGLEDFLARAVADPDCRSIAVSIEQIRRPDEFAHHATRAAEAGKRLTYLKVGRSQRGQAAIMTHTGAVAGDVAVYDAFLRDLGGLCADTPRELLQLADDRWPRKAHARRGVGVVVISGGEAALAADLAARADVALAKPGPLPRLRDHIGLTHENPIDVTGQVFGDAALIDDAVRDLVEQPDCGPVLVSFPPMAAEHFRQFTATLSKVNEETDGRVAVVVPAPSEQAFTIADELRAGGVAAYESLRDAFAKVRAFGRSTNVAPVDEPGDEVFSPSAEPAVHLLDVLASLRRRDLPVEPMAELTGTALPAGISYPVAVKLEHPAVLHRGRFGLLALGVADDAELAAEVARIGATAADLGLTGGRLAVQQMASLAAPKELLVGYRHDLVFGPVVILGAGGVGAAAGGSSNEAVHVQVSLDPTAAAVVGVARAARAGWLPRSMSVQATERVAAVVAAIWRFAGGEGLREWECNPLLVTQDGSCSLVNGVGFR